MKESVRSSGKGLPDHLLEDIDRFDTIPDDERANKTLNENGLSYEQIAITQDEANYTESQDWTEASNLNGTEALNINCTEAFESINEGFFEPEHRAEPESVNLLSQVAVSFSIYEGKEPELDHGSSSSELPVVSGSETGFPECRKVWEWSCTDEEPKDLKISDMKEDVEDLDEDNENNPIDLPGTVESTPALAQKPYVKIFEKEASWRDLATGTSNDRCGMSSWASAELQRNPIFATAVASRSF